jgi:hypothetical protein
MQLPTKDIQVVESEDKRLLSILNPKTEAGSSDITFFIYEPCLQGEDYPALVQAWDNKDDDIFDNI